MIDLKEEATISRAHQAERILKDPLFTEAWDKVKAALLAKFEQSPVRDTEGREHLLKMLKALNDAQGVLEQAMRDGKVVLHLQEEKRRLRLFR